jgi:chemotaxis regulatin CheY-phosphate phosphatase CheZ
MAGNALRQWLNVAVDAEKKKSLDSFHEQVLKDIPVGASKSETRLFRLLPDEDNAPLAGQLVWANLDRQPELKPCRTSILWAMALPELK